MLVESDDLLTARHAAEVAGVTPAEFQDHLRWGQIRPFVLIDGLAFFHRREVLALRTYAATLAGRPSGQALPRLQDLF
ncbi:MAG: hypothetical protein VKS61_01740 [Candidatus Sericytochromatia bacterium]|nr:hypothetical protein [Candidatus Sericytochromatia bacterium]